MIQPVPPIARLQIRVRGTVQGVGFRPTVYRLAVSHGLDGEVFNDSEGVCILISGERKQIDAFLRCLSTGTPPLARIESIDRHEFHGSLEPGFRITESRPGPALTAVSADAATCALCLADIFDPANRRCGYAFTNCTHCGPRLSIVHDIPYDRRSTSMSRFSMCPECAAEFDNPGDRRFHAQPNACVACGPRVWLEKARHDSTDAGDDGAWHERVAALLRCGSILAIKGIGGFHLACDASNDNAVAVLRRRKRRYEKPFALMARDTDMVRSHCHISSAEKALLESPEAPIVILRPHGRRPLAPAVAPHQDTQGFMLPYSPLHHLIMQHMDTPIVLTSGNASEEPQCIDNGEARARLGDIANWLVLHDRDIVNRLDDSVVRSFAHGVQLLRRARGYAPAPLPLPEGFEQSPDMLAFGGELKSTICIVRNGHAIPSQHLGDLESKPVYVAWSDTIRQYEGLFQCSPRMLAADSHPEYLSSKLARQRAEQEDLPLTEVQHHHAHIAACMADNMLPLHAPPVLGIALDGLGFGDDGTLWGGEFLLADYRRCHRLGSFEAVPMPGGSRAIKEPWRMAYAYLFHAGGFSEWAQRYEELPFFRYMAGQPWPVLEQAMRKSINCPESSACGRLFDAVASIAGLRHEVSYEAQGAIELEAIIGRTAAGEEDCDDDRRYSFRLDTTGGIARLSATPLWPSLLEDLSQGTPLATVSARFHRALARAIIGMVRHLADRSGVQWQRRVALSGGVFQNRVLAERLVRDLTGDGFEVYTHEKVPTNDAGLSLGQAAVAAARLLSQSR